MKRVEIKELDYFEDDRGWLLKILKQEDMGKSGFGEIYMTVAHSGIIKAQHYHKNTTEWFCVIQGTAKLVLQDMVSQERKEIIMGTERFITVKVPSGIAHAVKNVGQDTMYLIAVADQPYDPKNTDTYPYDIHI